MKTTNRVGIRTCSDYSPFGVELDGRTVSGGYRFGFQNQEKDDEIKGEGNSVNYTFRMHDPRLGRFFAVDPLAHKYPWNSVYAFSENRVTNAVELEGLESDDNAGNQSSIQTVPTEEESIASDNSNSFEPISISQENDINDIRSSIVASSALITDKGNAESQSSNESIDENTTELPLDGSSMFTPAKIYFKGVPKDVLDGIMVIPENAGSNKDLIKASNGKWFETDGLWIKGYADTWFKIPDINTVVVTYNKKTKELVFKVGTNIWGEILLTAAGKMASPDYVPDSGKTTHITDYPFK